MTNTIPPSSLQLKNVDPTLKTYINSLGANTQILRSGSGLFLKSYHLTGMDNYGLWAYRMKNILKRDGLFTWCLQAPSIFPITIEEKGRELALSSLNNNAKGNIL